MYRPLARVERQRSDGSESALVHTRYQRLGIESFAVLDYTSSITTVGAMRAFATPRGRARTLAARLAFSGSSSADGTSTARARDMPQNPPRSYDDITRRTVPEPDSSFRPTKDQERAAFEGERILSTDEQALHDKVASALRNARLDIEEVSIEIDGTRVTLRGRVDDHHILPLLESAVRDVADVGDIVDLVLVDPSRR